MFLVRKGIWVNFQWVYYINKVNTFKQSSKVNISKTDRKNFQLSNDFTIKSKEKKKIPELKFPVVSSLDYVSMNRSSRRADISKSGGSTSGHTNFREKSKYKINKKL